MNRAEKGSNLDRYEDELSPVLDRIDRVAVLLDSRFQLPGTPIRFGWDAIIGLIPVVGDFVTVLPQLYFMVVGFRLGVSKWTLWHMLFNILIDWLLGSVPIIGDLFDVAFKSNLRNAKVLKQAIRAKRADLG